MFDQFFYAGLINEMLTKFPMILKVMTDITKKTFPLVIISEIKEEMIILSEITLFRSVPN